jgi:transposase InsO family protein
VPCRIHAVLTDNGVQFTPRKQDVRDGRHTFDRACGEHGIERRLTRVNHPRTNGQAERMNRTIRTRRPSSAATTAATTGSGRAHLQLFLDAHDHARRPTTPRGLTPHEFVRQAWTKEPERFRLDPSHRTPGPHT